VLREYARETLEKSINYDEAKKLFEECDVVSSISRSLMVSSQKKLFDENGNLRESQKSPR